MFRVACLLPVFFSTGCAVHDAFCNLVEDEAYPAGNRDAWEKRIRIAVDMLLEQFPPSRTE